MLGLVEGVVPRGFTDLQKLFRTVGFLLENFELGIVGLFEHLLSQGIRGAARGELESPTYLFLKGLGGTFKHTLRKGPGGFHKLFVVESDQGLHGSVGALPLQGAGLPGWGIESHKSGMGCGAFPIGVHAPTEEFLAVISHELAVSAQGHLVPQTGRLVRFYSRSAEGPIK